MAVVFYTYNPMSRSPKRPHWFARLKSWCHSARSSQTPRQQRGRAGERLALAYLRREGYEIEATNARFPVGELDIVAREGTVLCFIEVRSRASEQFGSAQASITKRKRQHVVRAVRWYLQRRRIRWEGEVRFDVLAIQYQPDGRPSIELLRHAFSADE